VELPLDEGAVHAAAAAGRAPEHIEHEVVGHDEIVEVDQGDDGVEHAVADLNALGGVRRLLAELDLDPQVGDVDVVRAVAVELHLHAVFGRVVAHAERRAVVREDRDQLGAEGSPDENVG